MKTIRVVAAVIKAVNKNGDPVVFATQRAMETSKMAGNFPEARLRKGKHLRLH